MLCTGRWITFLNRSVVQRGDDHHLFETVLRWRRVFIGGQRQFELNTTNLAPITHVHLAEFARLGRWCRWRRERVQHRHADSPQHDHQDETGQKPHNTAHRHGQDHVLNLSVIPRPVGSDFRPFPGRSMPVESAIPAGQPRRSRIMALAMPPPSQIVWRPHRPPLRSSSLTSVAVSRAPEHPSG